MVGRRSPVWTFHVVHPWPATRHGTLHGVRYQDFLRHQDGVISREQARRCGTTAFVLRGKVARGELTELHPGVFRSSGHRPTDGATLLAAALWAGPEATLHGPGAAVALDQLPALPHGAPVDVTVGRRVRRTAPPGIRLRRRDLPAADRVGARGITVTSPGLTALETAAALPDGAAFLDRVLQRGLSLDEVTRAHHRNLGAAGMARAGDLLVEAADRADSRAERRLIGHLRRAGVDGFVRGLGFRRWQIDIAFPARRLAVEVDDWAFHSDPTRFRADRAKQNALVIAGWTVLRFTWHDIRDRPADTVARIVAALRR